MARELTSHKVNGLNEAIQVLVFDKVGDGGASYIYGLSLVCGKPEDDVNSRDRLGTSIRFQNGPVQEVGFNGFSNESLLAIVEDRLLGFQSGQFACRENAIALTKIQEAMMWLQKRTLDRIRRGVEGTHSK